ncbi:hypothetical protein KAR91_52005 [Candidatus Pacearchaeota archaeon]|nr:hypothetical protein [Candidatus Pacearchaeota archaeon]
MEELDFTYLMQPPKKWTFEQPKLKAWVEAWCLDPVLNLFAGKVKLNASEFRVDSSSEFFPDACIDAQLFADHCGNMFNTIILDPPYNLRKSREKYEGRYIGKLAKIKNSIVKLIPYGGRVISLGYDTVGMSKSRGFRKLAVCIICHSGDHNDTLGLVEERI